MATTGVLGDPLKCDNQPNNQPTKQSIKESTNQSIKKMPKAEESVGTLQEGVRTTENC